jgi:hypothetical protein
MILRKRFDLILNLNKSVKNMAAKITYHPLQIYPALRRRQCGRKKIFYCVLDDKQIIQPMSRNVLQGRRQEYLLPEEGWGHPCPQHR